MTNQKSNKRALLLSALSLLMCVSMLIGSTFAWFTDSVTSGRNKIIAGNLDVVLEYKTPASDEWKEVKEDTVLFSETALWEPGHTEVVALRIRNAGTLSLRYELSTTVYKEKSGVNKDGEIFKLSDYLTVGYSPVQQDNEIGDILMGMFTGNRDTAASLTNSSLGESAETPVPYIYPGEAHVVALAISMPTTVGNEANYKTGTEAPFISFGVTLLATQATIESDSFGTDYDKDAKFEKVVDSGTSGGVNWTLTDLGTLTIAPATTTMPDANSGKPFEAGAWREAVIYNSNGEGIAIGGYPYDVNAVKTLVIKEGVTSIGSFTAKFPNLTGEVIIPSTVTYIGQEAFQNAPITKLTFAKGGAEELCIAPGAFKGLAIEEVTLPDDRPVHIHAWAFNKCNNLKHITLPATVTSFPGPKHVEYVGNPEAYTGASYDSQVFAYCPAIETITFGSEGVKNMFFSAYGNQSNINALGSVTIVVK
jgi:predicted ribosomally synthesized peptide with SipW-like signal peptide